MSSSRLYVLLSVQARRNNRTDLIDSAIIPGALDIRTQIGDDLEEMKDQLRKQSARLRELEEKRQHNPGNYDSPSLIGMVTVNRRHFLWEGRACLG
jgi:hypothetical protein